MTELLKVLATLLLGPGGVVVLWLTMRHKGAPLPKEVAADAEVTQVLEETGVGAAWKDYADELGSRLNARIDELEKDRAEDRKRIGALETLTRRWFIYATNLRTTIAARIGPEYVPDWPHGLDPAGPAFPYYDTPNSNNERPTNA